MGLVHQFRFLLIWIWSSSSEVSDNGLLGSVASSVDVAISESPLLGVAEVVRGSMSCKLLSRGGSLSFPFCVGSYP